MRNCGDCSRVAQLDKGPDVSGMSVCTLLSAEERTEMYLSTLLGKYNIHWVSISVLCKILTSSVLDVKAARHLKVAAAIG